MLFLTGFKSEKKYIAGFNQFCYYQNTAINVLSMVILLEIYTIWCDGGL